MIFFLDTEFNEFGGELISMALVGSMEGVELYLATECKNPGPWVAENVMPVINAPGAEPWVMVQPHEFGVWVARWFETLQDPSPFIVCDWPDDIRYFCQALITAPGEMVNIRRITFDLMRVDAYPTTLAGAVQHNALWDARALRKCVLDAKGVGLPEAKAE